MFRTLVLLLACACSFRQVAASDSSFMLVSGISASSEMCVAVENGSVDVEGADVVVEPCAAAIAAGDGRELWQHLPNGQIANVMGKRCIGLRGNTIRDGGSVTLMDCDDAAAAGDGRSIWEAQGSGQLKLGRAGQYCLSQRGPEAGEEDAAAKAAIMASSSADVAAHGANMAVDGSGSTFWASALDPAEPVTLTVDLGGVKKLRSAEILWEFPAKSFSVSVTADGVTWTEVFATDSNVLSTTSIALGSARAAKARVVMHEAHATQGAFQGHAVYGIKTLAVYASRLQSIVEECADASRSNDARDKYFQSYAGEYGPCSSKALRSELPALEAARASVASVVSELSAALPKMTSCRGAAGFMKKEGSFEMLAQSGRAGRRANSGNAGQMARNVDSQNGVDTNAVGALLKEARRVIIAARSSLF